ncbi:hypothetical protein CXF87_11450 [Halomonas sp. MES3-P3E]|nr:hypothetical protein CXF87_11450 [Halomonas sp. MES3-P3E]
MGGKSLKLNAEAPYLSMPEPVKMPEFVGQDSIDRLENMGIRNRWLILQSRAQRLFYISTEKVVDLFAIAN